MKRKLRVLYAAAETAPYLSVGGLGEVARAYPEACAGMQVDIRRVMPLYQEVDRSGLRHQVDFPVPMGAGYETCIVKSDPKSKTVPTYFLDNARYFYRLGVYGHPDDGHRFLFFCKAVVEMLKHIRFKPDIVHVNDWHMGFLPLLLKKEFPEIKTVFTIHNLKYQGFIPAELLRGSLTEEECFQLGWPEWLNFMKAGILHAHRITAVSPTYSVEVQSPPRDEGLGAILRQRQDGIAGILNGIDTEFYNPAQDGVLKYPYDQKHLSEKNRNKTELRQQLGLIEGDLPVLSMITRLEDSKGMDFIIKMLPNMEAGRFQLIILGTGSSYYQGLLTNLAKKWQGMVTVSFTYHPDLARRIYAASDFYLMPSQMEPCGLGQLYAMRYGAVPIVSPVGGLKDTVKDYHTHKDKANGFYISQFTPQRLSDVLDEALKLYGTPAWVKLAQNGMKADFSWHGPAAAYLRLYKEVIRDEH